MSDRSILSSEELWFHFIFMSVLKIDQINAEIIDLDQRIHSKASDLGQYWLSGHLSEDARTDRIKYKWVFGLLFAVTIPLPFIIPKHTTHYKSCTEDPHYNNSICSLRFEPLKRKNLPLKRFPIKSSLKG